MAASLLVISLAACGGRGARWDEGAARAPAVRLGFPAACSRVGRVYLVPVGRLANVRLDEVAARYEAEYGLRMEVLAPVAPGADATDATRQQLVAEAVADAIARTHPAHAAHPEALLIGVTDEDSYARAFSWRFVFSARMGRTALVSTARMDPRFFQQPEDAAALHARLYKMLTKNLGVLYCQLPLSNNPRSVMFGSVMRLEDLDRMDESVW